MTSYLKLIEEKLGNGTPLQQYKQLNLISLYAEIGKLVFENATNIDFLENDKFTELDLNIILNEKIKELSNFIRNN